MKGQDRRTNTFNPEGRLEQVENSVKTISLAGSIVGLKCVDGVILAGEKSINSKLMIGVKREKTAVIDSHVVAAFAGMASDANRLIEWSREECVDWQNNFDLPIDCENVARNISNECHQLTLSGGMRPQGVSFLLAGYNQDLEEFKLFTTFPSGNQYASFADAQGKGQQNAVQHLKTKTDSIKAHNFDLSKGKHLVIETLTKMLDSYELGSEKMEIIILTKKDGQIIHQQMTEKEINDQVDKVKSERTTE